MTFASSGDGPITTAALLVHPVHPSVRAAVGSAAECSAHPTEAETPLDPEKNA